MIYIWSLVSPEVIFLDIFLEGKSCFNLYGQHVRNVYKDGRFEQEWKLKELLLYPAPQWHRWWCSRDVFRQPRNSIFTSFFHVGNFWLKLQNEAKTDIFESWWLLVCFVFLCFSPLVTGKCSNCMINDWKITLPVRRETKIQTNSGKQITTVAKSLNRRLTW